MKEKTSEGKKTSVDSALRLLKKAGLKQGDSISTLLLNPVLEKLFRDGQQNRGYTVHKSLGFKLCRCMRVIANGTKELQINTPKIIEVAGCLELKVSQ